MRSGDRGGAEGKARAQSRFCGENKWIYCGLVPPGPRAGLRPPVLLWHRVALPPPAALSAAGTRGTGGPVSPKVFY